MVVQQHLTTKTTTTTVEQQQQINKKTPILSFNYEQFVKQHKSQLAQIPKLFWYSLYEKIKLNILDLHKNIKIETTQVTYSDRVEKRSTAKVRNKNGLKHNDSRNIFLIRKY